MTSTVIAVLFLVLFLTVLSTVLIIVFLIRRRTGSFNLRGKSNRSPPLDHAFRLPSDSNEPVLSIELDIQQRQQEPDLVPKKTFCPALWRSFHHQPIYSYVHHSPFFVQLDFHVPFDHFSSCSTKYKFFPDLLIENQVSRIITLESHL